MRNSFIYKLSKSRIIYIYTKFSPLSFYIWQLENDRQHTQNFAWKSNLFTSDHQVLSISSIFYITIVVSFILSASS